jgi:hypothetical protein
MKLANALLRRKELQNKLDRMKNINNRDLFDVKAQRKNVTESLDDIIAQVPKLTWAEFNQEYDFYAKQLREIDGHIQQANWTTEIVAPDSLLSDFEVKK